MLPATRSAWKKNVPTSELRNCSLSMRLTNPGVPLCSSAFPVSLEGRQVASSSRKWAPFTCLLQLHICLRAVSGLAGRNFSRFPGCQDAAKPLSMVFVESTAISPTRTELSLLLSPGNGSWASTKHPLCGEQRLTSTPQTESGSFTEDRFER